MTERQPNMGLAEFLGLPAEREYEVQKAALEATPGKELGRLIDKLARQDEVDNLLNDPVGSERVGITEPQRVAASMLRGLDGVTGRSYRQIARELGVAPSTARRRATVGSQKAQTSIFGK